MKKGIMQSIVLCLMMAVLVTVCGACSCSSSSDYNSYHEQQVQKGVSEAKKIYKGR